LQLSASTNYATAYPLIIIIIIIIIIVIIIIIIINLTANGLSPGGSGCNACT
jgi:competence protein ComGC